jgi:hypothetical protein
MFINFAKMAQFDGARRILHAFGVQHVLHQSASRPLFFEQTPGVSSIKRIALARGFQF